MPKPVFAQLGVENEVETEVEDHTIVLRRTKQNAREGWAEASQALAEDDDDALVMGELSNADDAELAW